VVEYDREENGRDREEGERVKRSWRGRRGGGEEGRAAGTVGLFCRVGLGVDPGRLGSERPTRIGGADSDHRGRRLRASDTSGREGGGLEGGRQGRPPQFL
jgi:hypothetical protein